MSSRVVGAVLGPGVQAAQHVSVPFGFGMLAFWLATAGAIAASMLAQREFPPAITAQMRMPAPHLLPPPTAPVQQQVDVLALLQDDSLRPAELGPEPMIGRPPQSPGGSLPGYSGPLGAPSAGGAPAGSPLFSSAPQLRPLYEMNGGSAPLTAPPPRFPPRAPTPIPRASFRPPTSPPPVPPAPRPRTMPPPAARAKPGSPSKQTPAPHTPPPETPPPSVGRPATIASLVVPPPMVPAPPIVPERIVSARRAETDPAERAETQAREDETKERVKTEHQDETNERVKEAADDDREYQTAVELVGRPERADSESYPVGDSTSPNLDLATAEESALGDEGPTDRSRDSSADVETIALEKISMSELDAPDATSPAMHAVEEDRERPETERPDTKTERPETVTGVIDMERREERATSEASKMPVSTASESLPPPVEQPQATGPSPACPQCEAPMRWVEEHLRFYCKSCRMYF